MEPSVQEYKEICIKCPFCRRELRFMVAIERKEEKMEKRKIEVVKLGEKLACLLNDRISIEFSPIEIVELKSIFEYRAMKAGTYTDQTEERERAEIFDEADRMYEKERKEWDEHV